MSDELEPTERSRIQQLISEQVKKPTVGEVRETFAHTGNEDRPSNHEATVSVPPGEQPTETYRRRPVIVPTSGAVVTPQVGDLVLLQFPARSDQPFITGVVYGDADDDRAPIAGPEEVRINRTGASVEIVQTDSGDSVIRVVDREADNDKRAIGLEINTDTGDIVLKNQGGHGIEIPATGEVKIYGDSIDLDTQGDASFNT